MKIEKGTILNFRGTWGSNMASLILQKDGVSEEVVVPCENASTVRALDSYTECITSGHCIDVDKIRGMEIFYSMDDFGLILEGFIPTEHATPEMWDMYESGYED